MYYYVYRISNSAIFQILIPIESLANQRRPITFFIIGVWLTVNLLLFVWYLYSLFQVYLSSSTKYKSPRSKSDEGTIA